MEAYANHHMIGCQFDFRTTTQTNVGASLLAMAAYHPTLMSSDAPLSRASSLPQFVLLKVLGRWGRTPRHSTPPTIAARRFHGSPPVPPIGRTHCDGSTLQGWSARARTAQAPGSLDQSSREWDVQCPPRRSHRHWW